MRWYNDLYVGYNALENKKEIIQKIEKGKPQMNKYVIALPFNDYDVLDIYPSYVLLQKWYRKSEMVVVGITEGKEEAMDMIQLIIEDCFRETGGLKVKEYILAQMNQNIRRKNGL